MGEQIGRPEDGSPALIRGRVTNAAGEPLGEVKSVKAAANDDGGRD